MKISKKSTHYRLYKWCYAPNVYDYLPKSLCSYFWKVVFAIVILAITLPVAILDKIIRSRFKLKGTFFSEAKGGMKLFASLVLCFGLLMVICMIVCLFTLFMIKNEAIIATGSFGWIICLCIGAAIYFDHLVENPRKKYKAYKEDSLLKKFIKAKKDKVCPKLEWED